MFDNDTLNELLRECEELSSTTETIKRRLKSLAQRIKGSTGRTKPIEDTKPTEQELEVMRMVTEGGPAEWSWPYKPNGAD